MSKPWAGRTVVWAVCVAIWLMTSATSLVLPPQVDEAMVERAMSGAEWLAERASTAPERMEEAAGAIDLTDWLLVAGGATGTEYEAFGKYLAGIGYETPLFSVQSWIEEIRLVSTAADAHSRTGSLRSIADIEADLKRLPTVPLDDAGRERKRRLLEDLALAAVGSDERKAAAAAVERLSRLSTLAGLEDRE